MMTVAIFFHMDLEVRPPTVVSFKFGMFQAESIEDVNSRHIIGNFTCFCLSKPAEPWKRADERSKTGSHVKKTGPKVPRRQIC